MNKDDTKAIDPNDQNSIGQMSDHSMDQQQHPEQPQITRVSRESAAQNENDAPSGPDLPEESVEVSEGCGEESTITE